MTARDPIGVSDAVEAWDEYERDFMGDLTRRRSRINRDLAETPVAWHEWSSNCS